MKSQLLLIALLATAFFMPGAYAEDDGASSHSQELDKFYMRVGAFIPLTAKTQLRADTNYFLSAAVDTEQTLGQGNPNITGRIEGYWRYAPHHSIGFTYYKLKQDGTKVLDGDLRWDETYSFSGEVSSYLDTETFKVDYNWSFYRSDEVELALAAGLHVTQYDFGISGTAAIYDENGNLVDAAQPSSTGVKVTAPLPVVGFRLNYNFTPKTRLMYKTDLFAIKFDQYKGNMTDNSILVEYRAWKHVGFGGGLNVVQIQGESEEDNGSVSLYNRVLGAQLYLTLNY
jgi:hypothetical protein